MLKYLENNQEIPYSNPDAKGISNDKRKELLEIKKKGQFVVAEMKKMAQEAKKYYNLDNCSPGSWLDGSNTKTRKYLWTQMKYQDESSSPISVSIFVEKGDGGKAYFRISLEIKNSGIDKGAMEQYHKHLEVLQKPDLIYVEGSNEWGNPKILRENRKSIMSKIADGTYKKVQICKIIEQNERKSNTDYHNEVMTAISEIIPYYDYVLKRTEREEKKRGWLLTWNPANWQWEEYEEWCTGTKEGKKYVIDWTCTSKQPKIGDDVFLMKIGDQPRGIIAHGKIIKEPYKGLHYDPIKAAKDITSNHVKVEYDLIQNCDKGEKILLQDDLKEYKGQTWSPRGSGIEIKEPILAALKDKWMNLISINTYWPSLAEYDPGITKEDWIALLQDPNIINESLFIMLMMMLELGGESTCSKLAEIYGGTTSAYNSWGRNLGERVYKEIGCPLYKEEERKRFYTVPFVGRGIYENGKRRYSWRLRDELKEALESDIIKEKGNELLKEYKRNQKKVQYAKNMILYGPPGTGKTYSSAIYAVAICDGKSIDEVRIMDYDHVMNRYRELMEEERITFTTFHQSYSYEEFIEGIKPIIDDGGTDVGYTIEDGVFKKFCNKASAVKIEAKDFEVADDATIWKATIRKNVRVDCFDNDRVRINWNIDSARANSFVNDIKKGDIIITTDGSRKVINGIAVALEDDAYKLDEESDTTTRNVKWLAKNIEKEILNINSGKMLHRRTIARVLGMKVSDILNVAKNKNSELSNTTIIENKKPYVFIIDEINRGNISKIFGELITIIEDTKRAGMNEEVFVTLPYSNMSFSVPSNVYILGTMNTADRSIALMDTALRRRFEFIEMMPDVNVLRHIGASKVEDLDVALMLEKMNERIMFLYDREHTIGHAFFTKLAKNPTIDTLKSIFEKSIIPLLQEYFYEDYQKIQLVLGDNGKRDDTHKFILDNDIKIKDVFKGSVDDVIDLPEKKYTINLAAFSNLDSYKEII